MSSSPLSDELIAASAGQGDPAGEDNFADKDNQVDAAGHVELAKYVELDDDLRSLFEYGDGEEVPAVGQVNAQDNVSAAPSTLQDIFNFTEHELLDLFRKEDSSEVAAISQPALQDNASFENNDPNWLEKAFEFLDKAEGAADGHEELAPRVAASDQEEIISKGATGGQDEIVNKEAADGQEKIVRKNVVGENKILSPQVSDNERVDPKSFHQHLEDYSQLLIEHLQEHWEYVATHLDQNPVAAQWNALRYLEQGGELCESLLKRLIKEPPKFIEQLLSQNTELPKRFVEEWIKSHPRFIERELSERMVEQYLRSHRKFFVEYVEYAYENNISEICEQHLNIHPEFLDDYLKRNPALLVKYLPRSLPPDYGLPADASPREARGPPPLRPDWGVTPNELDIIPNDLSPEELHQALLTENQRQTSQTDELRQKSQVNEPHQTSQIAAPSQTPPVAAAPRQTSQVAVPSQTSQFAAAPRQTLQIAVPRQTSPVAAPRQISQVNEPRRPSPVKQPPRPSPVQDLQRPSKSKGRSREEIRDPSLPPPRKRHRASASEEPLTRTPATALSTVQTSTPSSILIKSDRSSLHQSPSEEHSITTASPASSQSSGGNIITSSYGQPEGTYIQYPAPADLIKRSRAQPAKARGGWRLFEEDRAIFHMLAVNDEQQVLGEKRFEEVSNRLQAEKIDRSFMAVKNFWNRTGRARSGFDERKNKAAPLATSKQGRRAKEENMKKREAMTGTSATALTASKSKKRNRIQYEQDEEILEDEYSDDSDESELEYDDVSTDSEDSNWKPLKIPRSNTIRATQNMSNDTIDLTQDTGGETIDRTQNTAHDEAIARAMALGTRWRM